MERYSCSHLGDEALARELCSTATRERGALATVLAQIGEFERRRLYLPAAFPSMLDYCIGVLGYTRQAALKRLRVARLARRFPQILNSIADGRLCLSGVIQLAPHLSTQNGRDLLAAAEGKTRTGFRARRGSTFPPASRPRPRIPMRHWQ